MANPYSKAFLTGLYRQLWTIRAFETRCIQLYRQGLIRGYLHPYLGQEAIAVGVCAALGPQDYLTSTHRGHGHCIARGADLRRMTAEITGKQAGYCQGRGGSMHIADMSQGNLGANGIVGGGTAIGVGAALSARMQGKDSVCAVFTSDGGVMNGTFGESLNLAAAWDLPVLFVIENNQYAVSLPVREATREPELYKRAAGYGVEGRRINGNHVLEVYETAAEYVRRCRAGEGPFVIEALTYRHAGHHVNDPGTYMPEDQKEHYRKMDPCLLGRQFLIELGGASCEEVAAIEADVQQAMDDAVEFARQSPETTIEDFLEQIGGDQ
ncbi:MAG TPA: thiamine pyrophosphate-dependent dehydrogenase E1 component subunit alpha [Candidatus Paceibacterota bacterium]|nr:thiamine pyrophosphate-dependent dehydrogenase E1 component subunit alpha [Verrucomicrobiota bacterium]HOX04209.1 thiamine pyrophosphate-dependent dehydrogenase E1 component subunit alpha [Verrucomicrobiota bacterium]HRZ47161.1 thiamine pyrophosphate-dependent dehydrogenase E1 component subunit alpha [Candidatus Paceibacterota bacterium]HRZ94571.1 thiamine pyrophosphate-dependent dehydrogenase E1 component subunit alpha [Candidatus Paceibacterota bacterium]